MRGMRDDDIEKEIKESYIFQDLGLKKRGEVGFLNCKNVSVKACFLPLKLSFFGEKWHFESLQYQKIGFFLSPSHSMKYHHFVFETSHKTGHKNKFPIMFLRCCLFQVMSVMLTMRVAASIPGWTNCIEIASMSFQIGKQSREPISFSQKSFLFSDLISISRTRLHRMVQSRCWRSKCRIIIFLEEGIIFRKMREKVILNRWQHTFEATKI